MRPVLAGAAAIAFVLGLTSFGVPAVLGVPAGFTTMTTRIYRDLAFSADPASFVRAVGLAIVLAVGAAVILALADLLVERRRTQRSGAFSGPLGQLGGPTWSDGDPGLAAGRVPAAGQSAARGSGRRPRAIALGGLAWAIVVLTVIVPLLALLLTAVTRAPGLDPVPANWTLDHFGDIARPRTFDALVNSGLLAGAAAVGVVALGALVVIARTGQGSGVLGGVLGLTFALPGSTLAVAILLAYGVALRDTLLIILVAYLAKFWALGYRPIAAGLEAMPADLVRAARVCGADGPTASRTVVLPLLRPLIVAGGLIVFVFGLHEVTMSSLLYGPGTATLAVVVLDLQQLGATGPTAALALVLTAVVALASLPLLVRGRSLAALVGRP
jgi:iron(III) transport system permease protein